MTNLCQELASSLGGLFSCAEVNGYTRIRTPFFYPDGDVIDVFCKEREDVMTVTDLGESLRWLRLQSLATKRSPKQNKLIDDVCLNHGLELYRGMITSRIKPGETIAGAVIRVAQGSLRVADLWFTTRTRSVESVSEEVELFLSERSIPYDRSETHVGRSGRTWKVDFHTRTAKRSSLMYVLSTGSRAAARAVAEHTLAAWYDLSALKVATQGLQFVSLFDDTIDVWTSEDFKLVEEFSLIGRWSRPDEVAEMLAAA